MQPRPVKIGFPTIAAAIAQPRDGSVVTGSLDNRSALRFSLRFTGPSLLVAALVVLAFGFATGRYGSVPLVAAMVVLALLSAVIIPAHAPSSVDLSADAMRIRGRYRKRHVRLAEIATALFIISLKEASRPDHERFFDTRVILTNGKQLIVGFVREGVVADLTKWLPHSKVTIRVISYRRAIELHPKDVPDSVPGPPGS